MGAVVLLDAGGNVLGTGYLSGTGLGGLGVLASGNDIPVAGNGTYLGSVEDGNAATAAELYLPSSVAVDGSGNIYIADSAHNRIRMVCASSTSAIIKGTTCTGAGIISTIAGNGNPAYLGDNGAASAATVNDPTGLALDGAGNLYIADTGNNVIRVISAATGLITTVAGKRFPEAAVETRGAATAAQLNQPQGVTLDWLGNLYIADTANHRIRMVTAATGKITTVAGNGFTLMNGDGGFSGDNGPATAAELNFPHAVAFDAAGNMYIPDTGEQSHSRGCGGRRRNYRSQHHHNICRKRDSQLCGRRSSGKPGRVVGALRSGCRCRRKCVYCRHTEQRNPQSEPGDLESSPLSR